MRKQELIHLHALGVQLRHHIDRDVADRPDRFAAYDERNVAPTAVHRAKDDHKEAVLVLFAAVGTVVEPPAEDGSRSPGDPIPGRGDPRTRR